jgi:hypothetical protein
MDDNIVNFIRKSLDYYDNQNNENKKYLENTKMEINKSSYDNIITTSIDLFNITKDNEIIYECKCELLGIFDFQTKVWISGWSNLTRPESFNPNSLSRELFDYVYDSQFSNSSFNQVNNYIFNQLINSRILIEDNMELDIYLATVSYLLKSKIKFIYPSILYLNTDKTKYIINYYLVL